MSSSTSSSSTSTTTSDEDDLIDVADPPPRPTAASLARAASFWQRASAIYLSYKATQLSAAAAKAAGGMSEADAKKKIWLPQHERAGAAMFDLASSLSGFYLKVGQFLSVREDFVALPVCRALRPLQESVRPMGAAEVRATLEDAFCSGPGARFASLEDVFESIDLERPLGSASVAQVHAAVLRPELYRFAEDDAGDDEEEGKKKKRKKVKKVLASDDRRVAVKVQRRGVLGCFLEDLAQIRLAAAFLSQREINFDLVSAVDELSSQIRGEFDFAREARVMNRIGKGLRSAGSPIAVPRSVPGLVARTALVMELLPGVPLTRLAGDDVEIPFDVKVVSSADDKAAAAAAAEEEAGEARKTAESGGGGGGGGSGKLPPPPEGIRRLLAARVLDAVTDAYGIMLFELGLLQVRAHGTAASLWRGRTPKRRLASRRLERERDGDYFFCFFLLSLRKPHTLFSRCRRRGEGNSLKKKKKKCDPHPGNIMVDTESSLLPRVGLIDYGQSKRVTRSEQERLARLFAAMAEAGDAPLSGVCAALDDAQSEEVAAAFRALGIVTEVTPLGLASGLTERDLILNTAYRMWDSRGRVQPFAANSTLRQLATRELPPELFFVLRSVQLLRGLAAAAGVEMSVARRWEPLARKVLEAKARRERGDGGGGVRARCGGNHGRPSAWAGGVVPGGVAADDEAWARSLLKGGGRRGERLASALLFPRRGRGLASGLWAAALLSSAAGVTAAAAVALSAAAAASAAAVAASLAPALALWVASLALQASWPVLLLVARRPGAALAHGAAALAALAAAAAAAAAAAGVAAAAGPPPPPSSLASAASSLSRAAPLFLMVPAMLGMLAGLFVNLELLVAARRRRRSGEGKGREGGAGPGAPRAAAADSASSAGAAASRPYSPFAVLAFGAAAPASSSSVGGGASSSLGRRRPKLLLLLQRRPQAPVLLLPRPRRPAAAAAAAAAVAAARPPPLPRPAAAATAKARATTLAAAAAARPAFFF